jgi:hypothetical protein
MSDKHSIASKARWAGVSKEDRSARMRAIAITRQAGLNKKQKRDNAMRMVQAKHDKRRM